MKLHSTYLALITLLLLLSNVLSATKALPNLQKFINPDGSCITIRIVGDHIFGFKQTTDGKMVEKGKDGYLYYVNLTPEGKYITTERAKPSASSNTGKFSIETINSIRQYNTLKKGLHKQIPQNRYVTKSAPQHTQYPVLLVEFDDVKFTVSNAKECFTSMLNTKGYSQNGATGSAADYFNTNFNGIKTFGFTVSDVITLEEPISTYGATSGTFNDTDVKLLAIKACQAAQKQGLDFADFDNDSNGIIENVAIIFAGYSESEGGDPNSIWPHQQMFEDGELLINGKEIRSYSISSELLGAQGCVISPIGTFCHEFLHSFGLPDMYDTNGELEGLSKALYGTLSIMDEGNFLNNGNTPPLLSAIEREILGISDIEDLLPDKSYKMPPNGESNLIYRIKTSNNGEYFLFEYRKSSGWDKYIGGEGLVAYHIDKGEKEYGGISCSLRWSFNNINCYAGHPCATVIPAGGENSDIGGIFFPGTTNSDKLTSNSKETNLKGWDGHAIGVGLTNISHSKEEISFTTIKDYSYDEELPQAKTVEILPFQDEVKLEWENSGQKVQWNIILQSPEIDTMTIITSDSTICYIKGLEPNCEYEAQIYSLLNNEYGPPANIKFSTLAVSSPYPYMYIKDNGYKSGENIDLRILNLPNDAISVTWYYNGTEIRQESIIFNKSGEYALEAVIKYKDTSYEKLYKKVLVN